MRIEVDQSGKIEQLNKDTYIAFSNDEQYCIKLPKKTKQEISFTYRSKIKQLIQKIFAICVYHCLIDYLHNKRLIVIDQEYEGWEPFIKRELINHITHIYPYFDRNIIVFNKITKESRAHKLALRSYREEERPNKILSKEEILRWLK
jgi:hypothetical protein